MIYRLVAYSFILLGIGGTIYMGVEGIYGDRYQIPSVGYTSLSRQLKDSTGFVLVDVRTDAEVKAAPAPWEHVIHIPLLSLEKRCIELTAFKDQPIILLCPTGNRSRQGARILRQAGFDAWYLEHGLQGTAE